MNIAIDRSSRVPLYRQLVDRIQEMIVSGALPDGFRLPPERRLAKSLGVNRTTVLTAYRQLKGLGLVDAHVGRGTAVSRRPTEPASRGAIPWRQLFRDTTARLHDPILAELLAATERSDLISFSIGLPAPELMPLELLAGLANEIMRADGAAALLHCPTEGHTPLRATLASWLASRGIRTRTSEVFVVSGSQQGLDLLARVFVDPGDAVVVEEPTYVGALQTFRVAGARLVGVPVDGDGMRTDILATVMERHPPKLIYTLPTYQNPSGAVMSLERRRHLLDLAAKWKVPVVEDDPYSELRYDGDALPSLKALDAAGDLVLYLSTFSKAVLPGLRIGYMVAPPVVLRQLVLAKQGADLHANSFGQFLLERFVREGHFADHLERLRPAYRARRDAMVAALEHRSDIGARFSVPRGGFYIWCELPHEIDATALMARLVDRGVSVLPGRACFPGEPPHLAVRLNFTHCPEPLIAEGVARFADAVREAASASAGGRRSEVSTAPVV